MSTEAPTIAAIRQRAAHWTVRLDDPEMSDAERGDFQRWVLADPRHATEFRVHLACGGMSAALPEDDRARLNAVVAARSAASAITRRRVWQVAALAASVLLVVAAIGWSLLRSGTLRVESYVTRTGEARTVTFQDGSVAYLNTRTQLKWLGNKDDRRVSLIEGEALFDVVHDAAHPFRVMLDNSEIRVRGTRFDVYRKADGDVVVTVLEGKVEVQELEQSSGRSAWQRELHPDQQITYRPIGLIRDVHATTALNVVKWREGLLQFEDQPVSSVLDELTRYTDQRILIRDPRIAQKRIGGALSIRDVRGALARIREIAPEVAVTEREGTFTLDYRSNAHATVPRND